MRTLASASLSSQEETNQGRSIVCKRLGTSIHVRTTPRSVLIRASGPRWLAYRRRTTLEKSTPRSLGSSHLMAFGRRRRLLCGGHSAVCGHRSLTRRYSGRGRPAAPLSAIVVRLHVVTRGGAPK